MRILTKQPNLQKVNLCFLEHPHHQHRATEVPGKCLGRSLWAVWNSSLSWISSAGCLDVPSERKILTKSLPWHRSGSSGRGIRLHSTCLWCRAGPIWYKFCSCAGLGQTTPTTMNLHVRLTWLLLLSSTLLTEPGTALKFFHSCRETLQNYLLIQAGLLGSGGRDSPRILLMSFVP